MKHPMSFAGFLTAISVSIVSSGVADAQDRPPPSAQVPSDRQECSTEIDPTDRSKAETQGQGSANLSDKLSRSDGVICPPRSVDREIVTPPPGGGMTPVIPPPGSPGGDPNVRPK
jgi:hypothetical protein